MIERNSNRQRWTDGQTNPLSRQLMLVNRTAHIMKDGCQDYTSTSLCNSVKSGDAL